MAWNDNTNRLWLLSMVTMGCAGGGSEPADTDSADTTTATTSSSATGDDATVDPQTSSGTVADDTTTTTTTAGSTTTDAGTTENTSSSSSDTGSETASDESTTSVEPPSPFVEECVAVYSTYFECFGGGYSDEEILALCTTYEGYFEEYSEGCLGSQTDYFACLSDLSCKEFDNVGSGKGPCSKEYAAGNAACPEIFSHCSEGGAGGGPDSCGLVATMCLDGNEYAVDCDVQTCTCSINGVPGETFPSPGVNACSDDGFGDTAETSCGFPAGVFF